MPNTERRAKIICTIGPSSSSERVLRRLIRAGMDVARLNFSHGKPEDHRRNFGLIRRVSDEEGRAVAVLQDLQGPKLRVGDLPEPLKLCAGRTFTLTTRKGVAHPEAVSVSYRKLPRDTGPGDRILIDDGLIQLKVLETTDTEVRCRVLTGGTLTSRKGINIPGRALSTPAMTPKDRSDLELGLKLGVDFVALSFVREAKDVRGLKRVLAQGPRKVPVIAKLEKPQAVDNLEDILSEADGIMVARGDLGVEMAPEQVPVLQKRMIRMARNAGKPVITATQMLESMVDNARPTRAEASDVANAIFDGTDAVMLSAETAVGRYPVETVKMMRRIIRTAEESGFGSWVERRREPGKQTVADAIGEVATHASHDLGAKVIAVFTQSGGSAQVVSKYRPRTPVYAFTPSDSVQRQLAPVWGIQSRRLRSLPSTDAMIEAMVRQLLGERIVKPGDLIVITAGTPVNQMGTTNFVKIHRVE